MSTAMTMTTTAMHSAKIQTPTTTPTATAIELSEALFSPETKTKVFSANCN